MTSFMHIIVLIMSLYLLGYTANGPKDFGSGMGEA